MKILISGADRGLGCGLTKLLLSLGHTIYAGRFMRDWDSLTELLNKYPENLVILPLDVSSDENVRDAVKILSGYTDRLDALISNAGISDISGKTKDGFTDKAVMQEVYNVNAVGAARFAESFMPFLEKSDEKKICFVSSEAGSVAECWRDTSFGYCMSKAALNMYAMILFRKIRPLGYKLRLYHPGWVKSYMSGKLNDEAAYTADEAAVYAVKYFFEREIDEDTLVLRGYDGYEFKF